MYRSLNPMGHEPLYQADDLDPELRHAKDQLWNAVEVLVWHYGRKVQSSNLARDWNEMECSNTAVLMVAAILTRLATQLRQIVHDDIARVSN
jgi:mannose/cellobiose epimerase-like protein (N-acyl-D-glucosamine 2-epimerase family)